jgi:FKBP-type peptidyl-prolyl cis-trans isomerase (trigger factor)
MHDLILEAIIEKEDITVSDESVEEKIQEFMGSAGDLTPELEERMREYWNSQRPGIEAQIRREKALQLIVDNAVITDVEPAVEVEEQE